EAVTRDPARAGQPAGRNLRLPAIAGRTAPGNAVGFEHRRLDAVFLRKMDGAGQPRVARADDRDIDIHVRRHRPVVLGRLARGVDPVGRCIIAVPARPGIDHRVVTRIVALVFAAYAYDL